MSKYRGYLEYDVECLTTQEAVQLHETLVESLKELGLDCSDGDVWAVDLDHWPIDSEVEPPAGHSDVVDSSAEDNDLSAENQALLRAYTEALESGNEEIAEQILTEVCERLEERGQSDSSPDGFDSVREIVYTDTADENPQPNESTMDLIPTPKNTNGNSSSSSSTTKETPKALDRSDIESLLTAIAIAKVNIDRQARAGSDDPIEQAELAVRLKQDYDEREAKLHSILERMERAQINGGPNYGLYTADGNTTLSRELDGIIANAQHKMDEAKDEAAATIRQLRDKLAEDYPEVYSTEVRDRIYAELVKEQVLAPYEPIEF